MKTLTKLSWNLQVIITLLFTNSVLSQSQFWAPQVINAQAQFEAVHFANPGTGLVVSSGGNNLMRTTNGGESWVLLYRQTSQYQPMYENIVFTDANTGYIGGLYGCRNPQMGRNVDNY